MRAALSLMREVDRLLEATLGRMCSLRNASTPKAFNIIAWGRRAAAHPRKTRPVDRTLKGFHNRAQMTAKL